MRHVYALLGLCKRYGDARVEETCAIAIAAEMIDVRRLGRILDEHYRGGSRLASRLAFAGDATWGNRS